jgi:hypothetical protein
MRLVDMAAFRLRITRTDATEKRRPVRKEIEFLLHRHAAQSDSGKGFEFPNAYGRLFCCTFG